MKYLIPLLPFGGTFHSHDNSKSLNFFTVTSSAPFVSPRRSFPMACSVPSTASQPPAGLFAYGFQPLSVLPSNRSCQPAAFSAGVSVLSAAARLPMAREATKKKKGRRGFIGGGNQWVNGAEMERQNGRHRRSRSRSPRR